MYLMDVNIDIFLTTVLQDMVLVFFYIPGIYFDETSSDFEHSDVCKCATYRLRNTLLLTLRNNISKWPINRWTGVKGNIGRPSSYISRKQTTRNPTSQFGSNEILPKHATYVKKSTATAFTCRHASQTQKLRKLPHATTAVTSINTYVANKEVPEL